MSDDRWLTVADVAEQMDVSKMTVYRLVNSGELPSTRVTPRSIRVRESAVQAHIRATSTGIAR
ncbi:helix-turn-helix transcriptional regulator [Nonomuraea sp. NPDC059023]|uniref:helix-turn-helix transcriptional regulator n=1 Tax=unclassified Nonomuraea TaxID=2593643 RepID=UPI0036A12867